MTDLFTANLDLAARCAHDWHLPGADRDDVHQECLIGLWVASTSYDPRTGIPFRGWAAKVIHGLLWKKLRDTRRDNRIANTNTQPLFRTTDDGAEIDYLREPRLTDELVEQAEHVRALVAAVRRLDHLNREALVCRVNDRREPRANAFRTLDRALRRELGMPAPPQKDYDRKAAA